MRLSLLVLAAAMTVVPAYPQSLSDEVGARCSAEADAKGLHGQERITFRAQCKAAGAGPVAAPPAAPKPATAKPAVTTKPTSPVVVGGIAYPAAVSAKYSTETEGQARMQTCLAQYNANKATNANGGLNWIQVGGGYYSECNKRLAALPQTSLPAVVDESAVEFNAVNGQILCRDESQRVYIGDPVITAIVDPMTIRRDWFLDNRKKNAFLEFVAARARAYCESESSEGRATLPLPAQFTLGVGVRGEDGSIDGPFLAYRNVSGAWRERANQYR